MGGALMNQRLRLLRKLFLSTLYLSAFTFGGGYVIITLMKQKFVDHYHWIEEEEMLDLVAIAQSTPGAIAVNGAIVIGYKLAGPLGALVAIVGTVLPPFVIISLLSLCYETFQGQYAVQKILEGMQAGVGAVIAAVAWDMGRGVVEERDTVSTVILAASFVASCFLEINVVYIILFCGLLGVVRTLLEKRRAAK